jgi:DNA-binding MarR family transcriptional regulator
MLKATTLGREGHRPASTDRSSDRIEEALSVVGRASNQVRLHERLLQAAGVRLDRGGASLLHKLHVHGDSLRVTALADLLGIDAPTVTRKVQQLERDGLVSRQSDPDDRRASRIQLTPAGRTTFERVLKARRAWLDHLLQDWDEADLADFARLLQRFSDSLAHEMEDARGN